MRRRRSGAERGVDGSEASAVVERRSSRTLSTAIAAGGEGVLGGGARIRTGLAC